jgi:hypothetical protein
MTNRERVDHYVMGAFVGMFFLCLMMLFIPKPTTCQVKMVYDGGRIEIVRFGVVNTY